MWVKLTSKRFLDFDMLYFVKFSNGGLLISLSQLTITVPAGSKMMLDLNVVKRDSKIIISIVL